MLSLYRAQPRAGVHVIRPSDYSWTTYHANALGHTDPLLTPHKTYLALGEDDNARLSAYRARVTDTFDEAEWNTLRQHTQQQRAWGSDRFRQQIEALTDRVVTVQPRGRPRKHPAFAQKRKGVRFIFLRQIEPCGSAPRALS